MLLTYQYPANHQLERLNEYVFEFFTTIRNVSTTAQFRPASLFNADFLIIINRSPKLKVKLKSFFSTFKVIPQEQKDVFYQLILKSQNIEDFFSDNNLICSDTMTVHINNILGNNSFYILMGHLFKTTLKGFDIKNHYEIIYNAMAHKVCPFCGVEKMHKTFQEDYDHLAPKGHYPIVAVHMKNLAPMCHTCNSKNKGEKDVLHTDNLVRRIFIYPYTQSVDVTIDFSNCVIPHTDLNNDQGSWEIGLLPDNTIIQNWDGIFGIKQRYKEDYLEANYEEWLEEFLNGLKLSDVQLNTEADVIFYLLNYAQLLEIKKFSNVNLIKAPLFRFLSNCGLNSFYSSLILRYNQINAA